MLFGSARRAAPWGSNQTDPGKGSYVRRHLIAAGDAGPRAPPGTFDECKRLMVNKRVRIFPAESSRIPGYPRIYPSLTRLDKFNG